MFSKTKSTMTIKNIVKIKAEEEKQRISLEEYTDYSKKLNRELVRPVSFIVGKTNFSLFRLISSLGLVSV